MKQLLKLLAANKGAPRRFEVIKNETAGEVTVFLYDLIVADDDTAYWYGGVSAQSFVKELLGITADVIHLRINSPGGDVFAARAMEQAIRDQKAKVIAHVDGYAASCASWLALACDEVEISPGGFFMIHKSWTVGMGNADDFTQTASLLSKVDQTFVDSYAAETGQTAEQLLAWMAAETWFDASESVEHGFADRVAEGAVKNKAQWDLSAYGKAPRPAPAGEASRAISDMTVTIRVDAEQALDAVRLAALVADAATGAKPTNPAPAASAVAATDELRRRLDLTTLTA